MKTIHRLEKVYDRRCVNNNDDYVSSYANCRELSRTEPTSTIYRSDKPDLRRVLPSGPLFLHPTEYPRVVTYDNSISSWKRRSAYYEFHNHFGLPWYNFVSFGSQRLNPDPHQLSTDWGGEVRSKVANSVFSFGEYVAEYRQTALLFRDLSRVVYDTFRFLKGKPPKFGLRREAVVKRGANIYLAGRYGVTPLALGLADAYSRLGTLDFSDFLFKVVGESSHSTDKVQYGSNTKHVGFSKRSDRAVCYFKFNRHYDQFAFGNPVALAYELIPLSFVVDWMFPIGEFLESIDALKGADLYLGTLSTKCSFKLSPRDDYLPYDRYRTGSVNYRSYERNFIQDNIPLKKLRYEPSTAFFNVLDGLALLRQRRG